MVTRDWYSTLNLKIMHLSFLLICLLNWSVLVYPHVNTSQLNIYTCGKFYLYGGEKKEKANHSSRDIVDDDWLFWVVGSNFRNLIILLCVIFIIQVVNWPLGHLIYTELRWRSFIKSCPTLVLKDTNAVHRLVHRVGFCQTQCNTSIYYPDSDHLVDVLKALKTQIWLFSCCSH